MDGLRNPLIQTIHLQDTPIHKAAFAAGGSLAVAAGRRPFFYIYDLNAGHVERITAPPSPHHATKPLKSLETFAVSSSVSDPLAAFLGDGGHVGLVSLKSRLAVGALKMNGSARCAVFTHDGNSLITTGMVVWVCVVVVFCWGVGVVAE